MSRVLPILFNTEMVRAILDGRKTVTRRSIKENVCIIRPDQEINKNSRGQFELYNITPRCGIPQGILFKPPCRPGDSLYVRETWADVRHVDGSHKRYVYKATDTYPFGESGYIVKFKWHPSIHMPKAAARIWLKVTDVRVEKLQDIKKNPIEARREGIGIFQATFLVDAMEKFKLLWNSTIKQSDLSLYGWDANPWVWVIEFEQCEKPGGER